MQPPLSCLRVATYSAAISLSGISVAELYVCHGLSLSLDIIRLMAESRLYYVCLLAKAEVTKNWSVGRPSHVVSFLFAGPAWCCANGWCVRK